MIMEVKILQQTDARDRLKRPQVPDRGNPSPRYGHLGMWNYCLGPSSPIPGPRLVVLIMDDKGKVVRRFEQIRGECTDPGYVDFFMSHNCRPAQHEYPIVDIDENGKIVKVLCRHYSADMGMDLYLRLLKEWAEANGKIDWGFC